MRRSARRRAVPGLVVAHALVATILLPPQPAAAAPAVPDPADFTTLVDNPFLPMVPGTRLTYRETTEDGAGREVLRVTHRTKVVQGVRTVVVRDRAYFRGQLVEDTFDWFAQDRAGNVWYFGEATKEYENGRVVSTEGSWKAGRDGARAGIVMKARPRIGDTYYQEHAPGVAMDQARVLSRREQVTVPVGSFGGVLKTRDFTRLDPGAVEQKFYARGVGLVLARAVQGRELLRLVDIHRP